MENINGGNRKKAPGNRTINVSNEEKKTLRQTLTVINCPQKLDNIINRTILGNTFQIIQYMPVAFADLIFIDPPYNITRDFNGVKFNKISNENYFKFVQAWLPQIIKLLKPNGSIYFCSDLHSTAVVQQALQEHLHIINRITWQRDKGRGAKQNWKNNMEDIWFAVVNKKNYYFNVNAVKQKRQVFAPYTENNKPKDWQMSDGGKFRITHPSNFWDDISIPYWSMSENTPHPTQKPEKLLAKIILASCPENGIVLDPFLGSGTTSVTAKKLGRLYVGIEMNEEYCCISEKRLLNANANKTIQGYADNVFWERNTYNMQKKSGQNHKQPSRKNPIPTTLT
ncbi:MAG: site-specific DNA-methyltransferase [Dysgonamonadaceae bacterium]|jgi:site-specific DNA-methyltransferase (adenine-specific)|nr:site-specific DNA-methyltransferase [Dysgonamonadaceae bacterium]